MMGNLVNAHMVQRGMTRHASSSSFFDIFEGFFPFLQELWYILYERMQCSEGQIQARSLCCLSVTRSISMLWKFRICVLQCVCVCCARTSPHLPQVQDRTSAANQAVTRESLWSEVLLPFGAFVGGGGLRKF